MKDLKEQYSSYADRALWQAFKAGDDQAYEYIYHLHAVELFSYGCHIVNDQPLVEDSIHDLFVYIFQHRATLGDTDAIKYYLLKSLRRRIINTLEKRKGEDWQRNSAAQVYMESATSSTETKIIEEETESHTHAWLLSAVDTLPPRQREAVYLLYFSDLKHAEIAGVMSLTVRTVYNQLHLAMVALRKRLKKTDIPIRRDKPG